MPLLGSILGLVGALIGLVCFILVLVKMFQHGQMVLGIVSILLCFCVVGQLIVFINGWMKAAAWNIRNVMIAWTVGFLLQVAGIALNPAQVTDIQHQIEVPQQPVR
jgi:hypothetical protein